MTVLVHRLHHTDALLLRERNGRFALKVEIGARSVHMYYRPSDVEGVELVARIGERVRVTIEHGGITQIW